MAFLIPIIAALFAAGGLHLATDREERLALAAYPDYGSIINVEGVQTHVVDEGEGEPVVLIHGLGGTALVFRHGLYDPLRETNRVIVVDRPGHGLSERPPGMTGDPREQAAFLHETLRQLELPMKPVLVAQSWGGMVATAYAVMYPDEIRGLVLLAPYLTAGHRYFEPIFTLAQTPVVSNIALETIVVPISMPGREIFAERHFFPHPVPDDWIGETILLSQTPEGLRHSAADMLTVPRATRELAARYGEITVPVTVVVGLQDQIVDPLPTIALATRHGWNLIELPDDGHGLQVVNTDRVLEVIRQMLDDTVAASPSEKDIAGN
ncbi:alpha/beta hydrolase [bacterium]|nr:alpha/beta hydrolase [bacterium]